MHGRRPDSRLLGARARAERTPNMAHMFVTLEVSKLSGWLKACAFCRVEGEGMRFRGERCELGGGKTWGVVAAHKRHARGKGPTQGLGAKGTRGAHVEHVAHGRDAGGVKAQRLVEGRRLLPSRKGRACDAGRGARRKAGGYEAVVAQAACTGKARDSRLLGARARAERTVNMNCMFVTLEVSRLSG